MLFIISPAKSLDFNIKNFPKNTTSPQFLNRSEDLVDILKNKSQNDISKLMKISDKLSELNYRRYQEFTTPFNTKNASPALFIFNGDVYNGIDEESYNQEELEFAQNNLRILSGLYGVLRPLDLIQAYRLEMGTSLKNNKGKNLYEFWSEDISEYFNKELNCKNQEYIINLASNEYSNVIDRNKIKGKIIDITFKNNKNGTHKNIGLFAKRARGLMSNFIIRNKVTNLEDLKSFNENGYKFNSQNSTNVNYHFYD